MGSRELPPAGSGELTSDESSGYDLGQLMELTPQERVRSFEPVGTLR